MGTKNKKKDFTRVVEKEEDLPSSEKKEKRNVTQLWWRRRRFCEPIDKKDLSFLWKVSLFWTIFWKIIHWFFSLYFLCHFLETFCFQEKEVLNLYRTVKKKKISLSFKKGEESHIKEDFEYKVSNFYWIMIIP